VIHVKQYLIVRMIESLDKVGELIALPGFYTLEAAQQMVTHALQKDPGSRYVIQEVGAA
jgi:hypothetical protein